MAAKIVFPRVRARSLAGLDVELPDAFVGTFNIVVVAFRRQHQSLVDSWLPWFEKVSSIDPGVHFYEVPTISRMWAPARRFIDGGMAASIHVPEVLQRTFTVYGDVNRITKPLGISDRSTIAIVCLEANGVVLWGGRGRFNPTLANELEAVLTTHRDSS